MMKTLKVILPALGLALGVGAATLIPGVTGTAYAAEEQKVSVKVGKPLQEAMAAGEKKQWDVAIAKLKEADAVSEKTPFDQSKINEIFGWVYINQKKYGEAAAAYEKTLDSGFLSSQEADTRLKQIAQLYLQSKQNGKAAEYIQRWLKGHPGDTEMGAYLAQLQYQQNQYKPAIDTIQSVIQSAEKQGQQPKEAWLQILLGSAYKQQDSVGSQNPVLLGALEKLVRYYPKPVYWESLLSGLSQQQNKDAVSFELYRLMLDTGTLKKPEDYVDYAQLASKWAGLPGDAQTALEAGFAGGILGANQDKDKHQRLLDAAKQQAAADRATLSDQAQKAKQASTGQADIGLGQAYLSYGQYAEAIEALERGLKKGGVTNQEKLDQGRIALGISYLRNNQRDKAREAFKAVSKESDLNRIASLWVLKASAT